MKLKELRVENLDPAKFWRKYIHRSVSVITLQAEISNTAKKDTILAQEIKKADVLVADGIGFIIGMFLLGCGWKKKCPGIDLIQALIEKYPKTKVYLWGATKENVKKAAEKYSREGLDVVGFQDGYTREKKEAFSKIKESDAKVVLIGMDYQRQLPLVNKIKKELGITAITVGGSFDVAAGEYKRAPKILRKLHLEGPWRILLDPKRIMRLPRISGFFGQVIKERFSK